MLASGVNNGLHYKTELTSGNGLDIRVSHESLDVQGELDREPTIHLSRIDWEKENRSERTIASDAKRVIEAHNKQRKLELEQAFEFEISR